MIICRGVQYKSQENFVWQLFLVSTLVLYRDYNIPIPVVLFFFLVKRGCSFKVYSISLLVFGRSKKNNNKVERLYWKNISIISKILYKGLKLCLFLKIIKQDKLLSLKWNKLCIYFLNSYKKIDSFCFGRERKISINRWWL